MLNFKSSLLLSLSLASLCACSAVKNMDSMTSTTQHMAATTDDMSSKMGTMSTTTQGMAKTTDDLSKKTDDLQALTAQLKELNTDLYSDLRQGNARDLRMKSLEQMEKTRDIMTKAQDASVYYMSFEYQLWKHYDGDDEATLQMLEDRAVAEYFSTIHPYIGTFRTTIPGWPDNSSQNLYALAATLDQINPNQVDLGLKKDFRPQSMLSMIESGLALQSRAGSDQKVLDNLVPYQKEVLTNAQDALYLLQVRANFVPALAMARVSKISDAGAFKYFYQVEYEAGYEAARLWNWLTGGKAEATGGTWDAELDEMNVVEIQTVTGWMSDANHELRFLRGIGAPLKLSVLTTNLVRGMRIAPGKTPANALRAKAIAAFAKEVSEFLRLSDEQSAEKR